MPLKPEVVQLVSDPQFHSLPWDERKKKVGSVDPSFAALPPQEQDVGLQAVSSKYAPKESTLQSAKHDLSLGFRQGAADLADAGANIAGLIPGQTSKGIRAKLKDYSKSEAPSKYELKGRDGILSQILQGMGSAPAEIAKYAPAIVSKEYSPLVAGAIGAVTHADEGIYGALQEGVRTGGNFYLQKKAGELPTRATRAIGSAIAMGGPTAIESGGDFKKTAAAAVTGAAMGAIPGHPEKAPDIIERKVMGNDTVQSLTKSLRAKLAPRTLGEDAKQTGRIVVEHAAKMANRLDQADYALRTARKLMDDFPENKANPGGISDQALAFIDHIETGNVQKLDPKLQPFAKIIRDGFDDRLKRIQEHGLMDQFVENYFPHLWENPEKAATVAQQVLSKRPLEGGKKFLKQRSFATVKDGIEYAKEHPELGLKLASNNPIDIALLQLREQDKFLTARDIISEMKESGLIKQVENGGRAEPGYAKINDKVSSVMAKRGEKLASIGNYHAPEGAAQVINNYLSPGLRDKPWFRAYLNAANSLNMFQLGFSAYHLGMTTLDAGVSQFALGLEQSIHGLRTGNLGMFGKGLATAAKTPIVPLEPAIFKTFGKRVTSNKIMEEWYKPGTHPEVAQLTEMMKKAGARVQMDPFYRLEGMRNVKKAFKSGNLISGAMHLPAAITENAMKWLFEYVVPMQKIGTFHRMAEFEMSRLAPNATDAEVRDTMQKAWRSVDNRMGQMVYDNLFWDKMAKDMMMASVRSVGWNLGTISEIGGGIKDTGKFVKDALQKKNPKVTHRMAYIVALPTVVGFTGGIMNYLMTGKAPQTLEDYYFPQTGQIDENGKPQRVSLPSYMKDVTHVMPRRGESVGGYMTKLRRTAEGKANPAISMIADMLENRDWRDGEIHSSDDPWMKQLVDTAKYGGEQLLPFSFRNATRGSSGAVNRDFKDPSGKPSFAQAARSFVGVTPAPAEISKRPYEVAESEAATNRPARARTRAELAKQDRMAQMTRAARLHEDAEFNRLANEGIKNGEIKERDVKTAQDRAAVTAGVRRFKSLSMDQAISVYLYAFDDKDLSADEKEQLYNILSNKISRGWANVEALPDDSPRKKKLRRQLEMLNMLDENGNPTEQ